MLYTKGADNVIKDLLHDPDSQSEIVNATDAFVEEYAKDGLRTLFLGKKFIDEDTYNDWNAEYIKASNTIGNREEAVSKVN